MNTFFIEAGFAPDTDGLLTRVGLDRESDEAEDFIALLEALRPLAKPKAAFVATGVRADAASGRVELGGVEFSSGVLARNVAGAELVWPHVATCGREMYEYVLGVPDPFERYWCEEILQAALDEANSALVRRVEKEFGPGKMGVMGPGSLADWPIEQQKPLFSLLREGAAFCGVELTPSMLMLPQKSVSGIFFPSEEGWESCMLCTREKCPNRRTAFDDAALRAMTS